MQVRLYPQVPEVAHCPRCHRPLKVPPFLRTAKISGTINLDCGHCKQGRAVIQPKQAEVGTNG